MNGDDFVLGIDGGGTSTIAWLAKREGIKSYQTVGTGQAGPSNLRVEGFPNASENVDSAITQAFESAAMTRCRVSSVCLAMAGSDRPAERNQWQTWVDNNQIASEKVTVTNDATAVIFAADPAGQGVALIAGTGSMALGRTDDGTSVRSGGWGPLIGDEGSGYAIALAGLRAVAKATDGRGAETELTARLCQSLAVDQPSDIIKALYSPQYDRPKIASLASTVFEAADAGDAVATVIIDQSARDLALMIRSVIDRLSIDPAASVLAITGGVVINQPAYVDRVLTSLRNDLIVFDSWSLQPDPVAGAVQIAVRALI